MLMSLRGEAEGVQDSILVPVSKRPPRFPSEQFRPVISTYYLEITVLNQSLEND